MNYRILFLIVGLAAVSLGKSHGNNLWDEWPADSIRVATEKGAWCWFADPRAMHYQNESGSVNSTYIGYIDTHGSIKATQINHLTGETAEVIVRSWFQPDDHNNPTFLALPDSRIMIFYSRHTDEPCFYYRISKKPGDITTLGKEMRLETTHNTTYPSPFILSDDPRHIYLCWRGIGWHPTIAKLTMPGENDEMSFAWGPHQIVQSKQGARGVRPYAKYASNGKDKIYLAYTTTHPDNQSVNYIYFNYIDIYTLELKDIKGNKLAVLGGALHDVDATEAYKNQYPYAVVDDSPFRNWLWEVSMDERGNPAIATVRISEDKRSHDYYYARWTGEEWQKTFLANAGGHFHQTPQLEMCYSGGMAIDKANPNVIYASTPVDGSHGRVYELKKFTIAGDGTVSSGKQLTFDSQKNNVRPFAIPGNGPETRLVWMHGDYYDWIVSSSRPAGFPTAIRANFEIPSGNINLEKGLLKEAGEDDFRRQKMRVPKSKAFTVDMQFSIDHDAYEGEILKLGKLVYGVSQDTLPKPYVKIGSQIHSSVNVLGTSGGWKIQPRGTGGQWYAPDKLDTVRLAARYEDGILRTYVNGLEDQHVETGKIKLSKIEFGDFKGAVYHVKVYDRALSQDEIKALK